MMKRELRLKVQDEEVRFSVFRAIRHLVENDSCYRIEKIEATVSNHEDTNDPLETSLLQVDPLELDDEAKAYVQWMNSFEENRMKYYVPLGESVNKSIPSIEKAPQLEQKQLPKHLQYAYLGKSSTLPVIISASLTEAQEEKLLRVLRDHKAAIGWSLADLKGIRPAMCMHHILLQDGYKPLVEAQRRLNLTMKEVVRKEVLKWSDVEAIYPIFDSPWVSPVQVVPKKGGMTVIRTQNEILLPSRTMTGWKICIDYRRLNKATRKNHFPLSFLDQMLDRLVGHDYYCFLDRYSGYNHIAIAPED